MKQLKYFVIGTDGSIKFVSGSYLYAQCVLLGGWWGGGSELHWMNVTHKSVHKVVLFFVVDLWRSSDWYDGCVLKEWIL